MFLFLPIWRCIQHQTSRDRNHEQRHDWQNSVGMDSGEQVVRSLTDLSTCTKGSCYSMGELSRKWSGVRRVHRWIVLVESQDLDCEVLTVKYSYHTSRMCLRGRKESGEVVELVAMTKMAVAGYISASAFTKLRALVY